MKLRSELNLSPGKFGSNKIHGKESKRIEDEIEETKIIEENDLMTSVTSEFESGPVGSPDESIVKTSSSCEQECSNAAEESPLDGSHDIDVSTGDDDDDDDVVARIVSLSSKRSSSVVVSVDSVVSAGEHSWEGWCDGEADEDMTSTTPEGDVVDTKDDVQQSPSSPSQGVNLKSILKKRTLLTTNSKSNRKITFNDMMTVFSDSLGTSMVAMKSDAVIPEDMYVAYEPPPEYQDCVDFEPPDEYKDERFEESPNAGSDPGPSCEVNSSATDSVGCDSSDETLTNDVVEQHVVAPPLDPVVLLSDEEEAEQRVNSLLTEENLKQHEQMMKKEVTTSRSDPSVPSTPPSKKTCLPTGAEELSPPLKQLSVRVANEPPPPGDDWQIELSPLNSASTQETESDSSLSSQDTIILMTSDESKRNEEHIKESLKVFEGLKKMDSSSLSSSGSDETKSSTVDSETPSSGSQTSSSGGTADGWTSDDIRRVIERNAMRRSLQRFTETRRKQIGLKKPTKDEEKATSLAERIKLLTCIDNDTDSGVDSEKSGSDSSSSPSSSSSSSSYARKYQPEVVRGQRANRVQPNVESLGPNVGSLTSRQRHSLAYHGYISPLVADRPSSSARPSQFSIHRSSSEMHVPSSYVVNRQSVPRERHHSGPEPNDETHYDKTICDNYSISQLGLESNKFNSKLAEGGVDELELFVKQDSDRIDRIRQRYSYSSEADSSLDMPLDLLARKPSVRGIKPKFGSTTEILKQMQTQIQPPIYASPKSAGNHMTWPYSPEVSAPKPGNPRHPQLPSSQSSIVLKSVAEEQPPAPKIVDLSQPMRVRRGRECLKMLDTRDERGAPEGASSSPKLSSDPMCPTLQRSAEEGNVQTDDGVIFYSMNV